MKKKPTYKPLQKTLTVPQDVLQSVFNGDRAAAVRFLHKAFASALAAAQNNAIGQLPLIPQSEK